MLDLEIAGAVRELREDERAVAKAPDVKRLRDSHHAVAKLLALGQSPLQVSLQTGYAPSRISTLQRDPAFQELMTFYRADNNAVAQDVQAQFLLVAKDTMQAIHERVLDEGETVSLDTLNDIFKVFVDRAGFAPVQRTVSKNFNLNIGERLDEARAKRKDAA